MYKVSQHMKTCNRMMFSVHSDFCVFHTSGIGPTPWQSLKPIVLYSASTKKNIYVIAMFTGIITEDRVTDRFLINAPAYFHTLSEHISATGAAIEAQQSATKSSSTVLHPALLTQNRQVGLLSYPLTCTES